MAFHHDLLEQAEHLVARERKRPKQASLRRAVSAAYYGLFHLLVADGAQLLSPKQPPGLSILIRRAFNHGDMRNVCKGFVQANVAAGRGRPSDGPPDATHALLTFPLELALVSVLEAFVELQEARRQAEYDLTGTWSRLGGKKPRRDRPQRIRKLADDPSQFKCGGFRGGASAAKAMGEVTSLPARPDGTSIPIIQARFPR